MKWNRNLLCLKEEEGGGSGVGAAVADREKEAAAEELFESQIALPAS